MKNFGIIALLLGASIGESGLMGVYALDEVKEDTQIPENQQELEPINENTDMVDQSVEPEGNTATEDKLVEVEAKEDILDELVVPDDELEPVEEIAISEPPGLGGDDEEADLEADDHEDHDDDDEDLEEEEGMVRITGGSAGGPPQGMMEAIMKDLVSGGGVPAGAKVRVSMRGGPDGKMHVTQQIIVGGDDDDDESDDHGPGGVPPEIAHMMKMTEMMHARHSGSFNPFASMFGKPKEKIVRQDESHADVLKRMHAIGDDLVETKKKYEFKDQRSERLIQVMGVGGIFLLLVLVSFIMTCRNKGKKQDGDDSDEDLSEAAKLARKSSSRKQVSAKGLCLQSKLMKFNNLILLRLIRAVNISNELEKLFQRILHQVDLIKNLKI